ncbi:hypothetical protein [Photobacterium nomapromontoriensis]|uniref:hypothetical protein n=1 Tax=Photobacterium nomapromontoriensis TaxID=2910237 RepID=UPI003D0E37D8
MKKAIFLLSALALVGCEEEDVKAALNGDVRVFSVSGIGFDGTGAIPAGYYDITDVANDTGVTLPSDLPQANSAVLENLGVKVNKSTCGKITANGSVCFSDGGNSGCIPDDITMLGLAVYTIDMSDLQTAVDGGFYPTIATSLTGSYADIDFKDVSCPVTGS